jgi:hypothetical protein
MTFSTASFRERLTAACAVIETLALAIWVGTMAGFAFLFAPIAYHTIGNLNLFATLIGTTLRSISYLGFISGGIALAASSVLMQNRLTRVRQLCIVGMLLATAFELCSILPQMEHALAAMNMPIAQLPITAPERVAYNLLHKRSSAVYGTALLLGLVSLGIAATDQRFRFKNS